MAQLSVLIVLVPLTLLMFGGLIMQEWLEDWKR